MAITFTPEQKQVIELHNCNILVSAAAGSGKTAVLSERIVQMVCREENPVDIDRLLVVTFTNAAAAEMRERISHAILTRLNEDGNNEHLQKQAALLHNAQITTIDSFCLFVLRNNFQNIGLDPAFSVADEGELKLLKQDVLAELLEERFASGEERFYACVEYYCMGGRESILEEHILDLYQYALSYPFPEEWLEKRKDDYRASTVEELEASDWGQYLIVHVKRMVEALYQDLEEIEEICEQPDGPYMYGATIEREKEMLEEIRNSTSLSQFAVKLPAVNFGRLPSKKDDSVSPDKRELAKTLRNGVKDNLKKLNSLYFTTSFETSLRQQPVCKEAIEGLVDLCLDFKKRLDERKREKKLLDFSDMEHFALRILLKKGEDGQVMPTDTALEYRDYFTEILIDEYQDSNLVQEYLLKAISREDEIAHNRFMVGDVKQSIYKFRLARPELFLEKYDTYSTSEGKMRRIDLHKNFRSRPEVIDAVNHVFEKIMTKELGGISYGEADALYPGAVYPENTGCESELILFEKPPKESGYHAKQVEAMGIAARIKELKQHFLVTDKTTGKLRPVMYRDIVVLLRTSTGWDEEFKAIFTKEGIPAYVSGKTGYFAAKEIQDILQFLKILDNPLQDIPLFGVMKSIFGGFTDEETALIRSVDQDRYSYLYDCLEICAKKTGGTEEEISKKCRRFLLTIEEYRNCTSYMTILELLLKLMEDYDYPSYVAALPAGSQRLANVEMLLTKAASFEKNSYYGLFHFIRYMEQLEKYNVDYGEASTLNENADVVRIMSIHKSKGLEFPVAIVAGLNKRFNMQDSWRTMIIDVDLGLGTDYVNSDLRIKSKTLRKNVLATKIRLDNIAEELRVLYVAMTRAREKLIMTGIVDNPRELVDNIQPVKDKMSYTRLTEASGYLDYLLPVFPLITVKTLQDLSLEELREGISEAGRINMLARASEFANQEDMATLWERFSYNYPHKELEKLYTKTTVSELKKAAMESDQEEAAHEMFPQEEIKPYIPGFMREKEEVSGTTRGSAVHRVLELLDFTKEYPDTKMLAGILDGFCNEGRLTIEYRKAVNDKKILHFLQSPLAKRMRAAAKEGRLYREQPFVYGIQANRLQGKIRFPEDETVLIQGIVDAFFEEEDGIVLLDYKTDLIQTADELIKRYRVQLHYYEEALKNLTGKKIKEKILYSFCLGYEISV